MSNQIMSKLFEIRSNASIDKIPSYVLLLSCLSIVVLGAMSIQQAELMNERLDYCSEQDRGWDRICYGIEKTHNTNTSLIYNIGIIFFVGMILVVMRERSN